MWVLPFYMWFIFKVLEPYEFYPIRHLVKRRIIGEKIKVLHLQSITNHHLYEFKIILYEGVHNTLHLLYWSNEYDCFESVKILYFVDAYGRCIYVLVWLILKLFGVSHYSNPQIVRCIKVFELTFKIRFKFIYLVKKKKIQTYLWRVFKLMWVFYVELKLILVTLALTWVLVENS